MLIKTNNKKQGKKKKEEKRRKKRRKIEIYHLEYMVVVDASLLL